LRTEDRIEEANKLQEMCNELEQKVSELRDTVEAQSKIVLGNEQFALYCKKLEEQLLNEQKALQERGAYIDHVIGMLEQINETWRISLTDCQQFQNSCLNDVCFYVAVQRHIAGLIQD
jgi:hypothetical protein